MISPLHIPIKCSQNILNFGRKEAYASQPLYQVHIESRHQLLLMTCQALTRPARLTDVTRFLFRYLETIFSHLLYFFTIPPHQQ